MISLLGVGIYEKMFVESYKIVTITQRIVKLQKINFCLNFNEEFGKFQKTHFRCPQCLKFKKIYFGF